MAPNRTRFDFLHAGRKSSIDYLIEDRGYTTPCWTWQLKISKNGYGHVKHKKVTYLAHRFYFERLKGDVPDGKWLDHLCRNRNCVNPDHLEPVPPAINQRRGRQTTLNAKDIEQIKSRSINGESQYSIAKSFQVKQPCISRIVNGVRWADVGMEV